MKQMSLKTLLSMASHSNKMLHNKKKKYKSGSRVLRERQKPTKPHFNTCLSVWNWIFFLRYYSLPEWSNCSNFFFFDWVTNFLLISHLSKICFAVSLAFLQNLDLGSYSKTNVVNSTPLICVLLSCGSSKAFFG